MELNYFQIFPNILKFACKHWQRNGPTKAFLQEFYDDLKKYGHINLQDILLTIKLAIFFTVARYALGFLLFKPLVQWFQFTEKEGKKFPESSFKLMFYFCAYSFCVYILLISGRYNFLGDFSTVWKGWQPFMPVPGDIYWLYAVEGGFYFHSIYATLFMDMWRRDSVAMIIHHALTLTLIGFSYSIRYHRIGVIVLFLHDISDIFLEFSKICVCMKTRGGKHHRVPAILVNVGFLTFTVSWFVCRLYLYPRMVLLVTGSLAVEYVPDGPFYFFFNAMLWILFGLNLYWFHFIMWLIIRVMSGTSRELEDTREIPQNTKVKSDKSLGRFTAHQNGTAENYTDPSMNGHVLTTKKLAGHHVKEEKVRLRNPRV